jgi:ferredoxin
MLVTQNKPIEEILELLKNDKNIFLVVCNGCPEACETGGEKALKETKEELQKHAKTITGSVLIDFLCNKMLVTTRLFRYAKEVNAADSVLVLSCGIGVQAVSKILDKAVHPGLDTISLGGFQGLWPSDERCEECGQCYLGLTGGICPITFCSKSLLSGPCGGTKDGKCEVDSERDCGWHLIYERLKKIGRLDILKKPAKPRNYQKMLPLGEVRKKIFYDIEQ